MLRIPYSRLKAFPRDRAGNVALIFALALPAIVLISVGAIELMNLSKDRSRLQDIADATALNAAAQMRLAANDQLLARAATLATNNTDGLTAAMETPIIRFLEDQDGPSGIEVALTARRTSFFGNLLPPGGFVIKAVARAQQLGATPLCVLGTSTSESDVINIPSGSIIARSCLVHSNKDINMGGGSLIDAAAVQAAGAIRGGQVANSGTGAPPLDDPLSGMFTTSDPGACQFNDDVEVERGNQTVTVNPGIHCRDFDVEAGVLRFLPGVHHLKEGELDLGGGAKIEGANTTLIIWKDFDLSTEGNGAALLDLSGSQGGAGEAGHWAGFSIAVDPEREDDLVLNFREIRRLEGVVYAPTTRLIVPAGMDSGAATPWTVVVAQELRIEGGRRLQINADYATSAVPVPNGVGNRATDGGAPVRLTH